MQVDYDEASTTTTGLSPRCLGGDTYKVPATSTRASPRTVRLHWHQRAASSAGPVPWCNHWPSSRLLSLCQCIRSPLYL